MTNGVVSVSFGKNGDTRKFKSGEEFHAHIKSPEFLGWIDLLGASDDYPTIDQFRNRAIGEIRNQLVNYTWPNGINSIETVMNRYPLPTGGSPLAKAIEILAKSDVNHAARVLMASADMPQNYSPKAGKAAAELLLIEKGISKSTTEAALLTMKTLSQEFREQIESAKLNTETQADVHRDLMKSHDEEFREALSASIQTTKDQTSEAIDKVRHAIDDMESTKMAYIEHMALDASVDYWKRKADRHKDKLTKGWSSLEMLVPSYFLAAAVAVAAYLICFAIPNVDKAQPEKTVLYATLGVFLTSMILWYGRLLTRQLISHRNLLEDAEERQVMIKSYIAMTKEGHVSKEDRVLALGAAFRSAGSGHPSDDGSSDISTAAIIGRLVQNDKA